MGFETNARATTGIRLDFHTDSRCMVLETEPMGKYEVWLDGILYDAWSAQEESCREMVLSLPDTEQGTEHRVTVYFPAHGEPGILKRLMLDDGAYVRAHRFDKKILFMGDSITQGWAAKHDSLSFAHRVSRHFNAESVIQGVGGACFFPEVLKEISFDPDWIVVAYGTNDYSHGGSREKILNNMENYFFRLAELYPHKEVFVLSPVWRERMKNDGSLDFAAWRRAIAEQARHCGFVAVDGAALMPPLSEFYTDGLHPDDNGFSLYAERLIHFLTEYEKKAQNQ